MTTPHPLLPCGLEALAGNISRGFGLDVHTTTQLVFEAAAVVAGNSFVTRTPDGRTLPPVFNVALVSNGTGFPRGALTTLLGPATDLALQACERERHHGARATMNALEAAWTSRRDLLARLEEHQGELRTAKTRNRYADSLSERALNGGSIGHEEVMRASASGFDFEHETMLELKIRTDQTALEKVEAEISVLRLRDEARVDWRGGETIHLVKQVRALVVD